MTSQQISDSSITSAKIKAALPSCLIFEEAVPLPSCQTSYSFSHRFWSIVHRYPEELSSYCRRKLFPPRQQHHRSRKMRSDILHTPAFGLVWNLFQWHGDGAFSSSLYPLRFTHSWILYAKADYENWTSRVTKVPKYQVTVYLMFLIPHLRGSVRSDIESIDHE